MELPQSKTRQGYIDQVKKIETSLKEATSGYDNESHLSEVQQQLDTLALKYQYNEEIGTARYKLYELQAIMHYFSGNDDTSLDFINMATEMRGNSYPRAEKLKAQLAEKTYTQNNTHQRSITKQERRKKLIGLEGWLAVFVVGIGVGILLNIISLFGYGPAFNDLSSVSSTAAAYVSAITPVLWFEILTDALSIGFAIWLIDSLARRRKIAKTIAIIYLISSAVLLITDYTWAASVFNAFNVTQYVQSELSKASSDTGRGILAACIWVPYFLVSRRVRTTLTE